MLILVDVPWLDHDGNKSPLLSAFLAPFSATGMAVLPLQPPSGCFASLSPKIPRWFESMLTKEETQTKQYPDHIQNEF